LSEIIKVFDKASLHYDDWYQHPQGSQIFEAELKAIKFMIQESGIGLELGAGTGMFAKKITQPNRLIVCLDPSKDMLKRAIEKNLISIISVGESLPFRNKVFHFVYLITVLEFLNNPERVLDEINSANQGPIVILFINSESSWGNFYRKIGDAGDPVFSNAKIFSFSELEELLNDEGFKIVDKIGTLTTNPINMKVGKELVDPSEESGVIIIKVTKAG
jgi:SAM-dependent methyltransferase